MMPSPAAVLAVGAAQVTVALPWAATATGLALIVAGTLPTVRVTTCSSWVLPLSARTVKAQLPAVPGVPVSTPEVEPMDPDPRQVGVVPTNDHVGAGLPLAVKVRLMATPLTAEVGAVEVMRTAVGVAGGGVSVSSTGVVSSSATHATPVGPKARPCTSWSPVATGEALPPATESTAVVLAARTSEAEAASASTPVSPVATTAELVPATRSTAPLPVSAM
ncbi:hypothetical protein [Quadrisphaera sp. INWT6]|uniref:hypothetical protein n=1 Tax=Quadrisphaera sp. INWT6 TaxID=2596917 RepID=UPI001892589D|nr:hypothetical protein [Quadrisphaera sp. INWT6]MBF5081476.1 hypothetical protein [Quadrisphaera sp. INWT6]